MARWKSLVLVLPLIFVQAGSSEESRDQPIGSRPYEMEWAGRTEDAHPPLVDFEDLDGWTVDGRQSEARFFRSRRQQLWGDYVGQLEYRGTGSDPVIYLEPPQPIPLPEGANSARLWVYGNNWAWIPDPSTPAVDIALLLGGDGIAPIRIPLGIVNWKEWSLMHYRLQPDELEALGESPVLRAIEVRGGRNEEFRQLYFDNLALVREAREPLQFEPRRRRNLTLFPYQSSGTNTGPGQLPFPTREETILPDNRSSDYETSLEQSGNTFRFRYRGDDGELVYEYRPATGTLTDIVARWKERGEPFRPLVGGGIALWVEEEGRSMTPRRARLISSRRLAGDVLSFTWRCSVEGQTVDVTYRMRLWGKSLVVDVMARGGRVGEVRFGRAVGASNPRLVTVPYLTGDLERPAVLVMGEPEQPLFAMGIVDHYRSNASELWAKNHVSEEGVWYNGGSRYRPLTNGRRNDSFERLFLTVSPRFEEVLPNVPNPESPWKHVAGTRLWRSHGASDRQQDYALWERIARYGMTQVIVNDHETGWRDGGESFTFRMRAAPGKGGDEGQAEYARKMRDLGFRYGLYNNYTDLAPVNAFWDEDRITRLPDGQWRRAWPRCYNPKPARAVELATRIAPVIQKKFDLDTAYCDVHTAVQPWDYVDYDARVPGAGTFAATFYAYGEILLNQKEVFNGPVFSEGNNHWYYCGLADGNYGQDQLARLSERPWLVDFNLRKLHPLAANIGMGNLDMFYGRGEGLGDTPAERDARLDRFLAATLAFGHSGFLVLEGGIETAVRSYFLLQQVQARYAQATVAEIHYADAEGELWETSDAVAQGIYERSQIATRYNNGLRVLVNGHPGLVWRTDQAEIPPNGWFVRDEGSEGELVAYSALVDGHRADYVDSPAYLYADGRGRRTRFDDAMCDGQMIVHRRENGTLEVIPVGPGTTWAVGLEGRTADVVAWDEAGRSLGPAATRFSRGLVHIMPVDHAFRYVLTPGAEPETLLDSRRSRVVPGETVTVLGQEEHTFQVPEDAQPGQQIWRAFEDAWIDFLVTEPTD